MAGICELCCFFLPGVVCVFTASWRKQWVECMLCECQMATESKHVSKSISMQRVETLSLDRNVSYQL